MIVSDKVLHAGSALFDFDPAVLAPIESGGAPDGATYNCAGRFIVKFIPTTSDAVPAIREKIAFVHYLREHGVSVPDYLPSTRGERIEVLNVEGAIYTVSKAVKAPGQHIWELCGYNAADWPELFFRQWGGVLGRVHALSQQYQGGVSIMHWPQEHAFLRTGAKTRR